MITKSGNLHLEIQVSRKNPVGILRSSYRDPKDKKIKHTQHGRITGCTLEQLKIIQAAFREEVVPIDSPDAFEIIAGKELGACAAVSAFAKSIGLDKLLYSRNEMWVRDAMVMIIGRLVNCGSKLSLANTFDTSCLWELFGIDDQPNVQEHCYAAMDELLKRQASIQRKLAKQHLSEGHLILYDITSTYFEGKYTESQLVSFGHNRDGKKGKEQVVIGLICSPEGCPIAVEVYPGNTKDESTVIDKIAQIRNEYALSKIVFVGDRGMLTQSNLKKLKDDEELHTITALNHGQMQALLKREIIQLELFDDSNISEVTDPEHPAKRYCLCRNPFTAQREARSRETLIAKSDEQLKKIANYKRATTVEVLASRIGRQLQRYKMAKFLDWEIEADPQRKKSIHHKVKWKWDTAKQKREARLDGCYIITTDVPKQAMGTHSVVDSYKSLNKVEQAFRNLKTVQLEMRPVHHHKDMRIQAHVFICMLAYYLQWHMQQKLRPLFEQDKVHSQRRWTFKNVIEKLRQIKRNVIEVKGATFTRDTRPDADQQKIIDLLEINWK